MRKELRNENLIIGAIENLRKGIVAPLSIVKSMNEEILINHLRDALFECYSKELCYPKIASEWSEGNKTLGMCAITALVVNDYSLLCKIRQYRVGFPVKLTPILTPF